jgi:hypothetical protein
MSWERAVEEVLFRKVGLRFRKGVETSRLAEVCVEDADYAKVDEAMTNYLPTKSAMSKMSSPISNGFARWA